MSDEKIPLDSKPKRHKSPKDVIKLKMPEINLNLKGKLKSENIANKGKNNIIKDMKAKISNNDCTAVKELLDTQTIRQQTKNLLLIFSFQQLYLNNNNLQKKIIVELIKSGADPKFKFDINEKNKMNIILTPLSYCCIKGDNELFDELIKNKINISIYDDENKNYFFYFFENDNNIENKYKIAKSIFEKDKKNKNKKININDFDKKTGMTLLMLSVYKQYINFIELFLENGADINLQNKINGDTALHYAVQINNKKIIELLIKHSNCILLIKNNKNETVIDVANNNKVNKEIYLLLDKKYKEQQKLFEEKNNKEKNQKEVFTLQDLNSYIEIPFQFTNEIKLNNIKNKEEKDNIENYIEFNKTPILNINLKNKEDKELLIIDNLENENEEYDIKFEDIENNLNKLYEEHNQLMNELSEINNKIKSVNQKINKNKKEFEDKENKYIAFYKRLKKEEDQHNSTYDILSNQYTFWEFLKMNEKNQRFDDDINDSDETLPLVDILDNLNKDIIDFQQYIKSGIKKKQKFNNKIRSLIQEILDENGYDYTAYIFGSYSTGLCLPQSELDLILYNKNQSQKNDKDNSTKKLIEIKELLSKINWINKPTLVLVYTYKAFPYIKFETDKKYESMKVNIIIQDKTNKGYECINLTNRFLNLYKNMEPLVLIVKNLLNLSNTLFSLNNYNDNGKEKINSYCIILMVVFFIQNEKKRNNIEYVNNKDNLGILLINFLKYYINYNQKIFVFPSPENDEEEEPLELEQYKNDLVIIEPLNHKNIFPDNVDFKNIKNIFNLILKSLNVKCDCSCHCLKEYCNSHGNNIYDISFELTSEHSFLKRMFQTAGRINQNIDKNL